MFKFAILGLVSLSTAFATQVTYTASGAWSNAGGGCAIVANALNCTNGSISFTNIGATLVTPTIITDAEQFTVTAPNASITGLGFSPIANFTLTINQSVPSVGSGGLGTASLSGTVFSDSGSLVMQFTAPTSFNIGVVSYTLVNVQQVGTFQGVTCSTANPCMLLNGPSTSNGTTSLSLLLQDTSVPEPATFGVIGAALLGFSFVMRRRRSA